MKHSANGGVMLASTRLRIVYRVERVMVDINCINTLRLLTDGMPRSTEDVCAALRIPKNQVVPQVWVALGQLDLVNCVSRKKGGAPWQYAITKLGRGYLDLYDKEHP